MRAGARETDMCTGPVWEKILGVAVPLILTGFLQLIFQAANIAVVGRFADRHALAAVGSTSHLIKLMINVFIGLSIGTNILVARHYGEQSRQDVEETVHTSILLALLIGGFLAAVGLGLSRFFLERMGTPPEVIELSVVYLRIYMLSMPAVMLFQFGNAILRAVGDTRQGLYVLPFAGFTNLLLDLLFLRGFQLGIGGVAAATVAAQYISALWMVRCLLKADGGCRLNLRGLHLAMGKITAIIRNGLPAGLQAVCFSLSNVVIQSGINSFGADAVAGNTAASNLEDFIYIPMIAIYQTALSFASQNYGAGELERIRKGFLICLGLVGGIGITMGYGMLFAGERLLGVYSVNPEVIHYGLLRLRMMLGCFFIFGMMEVMAGLLRGIGCAGLPTVISLLGACILRIFWVYAVLPGNRTLETLYLSYPVSWVLTFTAQLISFLVIFRKVRRARTGYLKALD